MGHVCEVTNNDDSGSLSRTAISSIEFAENIAPAVGATSTKANRPSTPQRATPSARIADHPSIRFLLVAYGIQL